VRERKKEETDKETTNALLVFISEPGKLHLFVIINEGLKFRKAELIFSDYDGNIKVCRIHFFGIESIESIFPAGFARQEHLNKHPTVW